MEHHSNINYDYTDSLLLKWQYDSSGCIGLRTIEMSKNIISKYNLLSKNSDSVMLYLGKPNRIEKKQNWYYYIQCSCDSAGNLIDSIDYCWSTIRFNEKMEVKEAFHSCI